MDRRFHTLHPEMAIREAVKAFRDATREEGKKVFGMLVIDDRGHLVGMLSMYDILIYIQPKHTSIWSEIEQLDPDLLFKEQLRRVQSVRVDDIMTSEVVTVRPETHLLVIADIMIKKHIRRLPVVSDRQVVGIVYVSDVFYEMLHTL
ncbi:MAG: CBS domain-containing protein [Desulfobacterales bacterium]|nr:CBS domain-containing protein [Desulfobacterales bacterium]